MRHKTLKVLFFVISAFVFSCSPSKEKLDKEIKEAETQMFGNDKLKFIPDTANIIVAIKAYEKYAANFKEDSMSAEYLFRAADLYRALSKPEQSIALYDRIRTEFPNSHRAPYSLFLKAFIYENEKRDIAKAEEMYKSFLAEYPNHTLADDAEISLKNLGTPAEELIKQFEQLNSDSLTQ
jgi:outer membrane protein assembly factor BamD (BamD/ComL family)